MLMVLRDKGILNMCNFKYLQKSSRRIKSDLKLICYPRNDHLLAFIWIYP